MRLPVDDPHAPWFTIGQVAAMLSVQPAFLRRIEAEGLEFQQRVAAGFAVLARRYPERVRLIDGFRDVQLVAADVEAAALEAVAEAGLRLGG